MVPNSPYDDTQSIQPASDPREIARQNLLRPSEVVAKPERIGPYKILETLGEGGMGIVYLAEQTKPIHRRVALKIIKLGMDTKQVIARFETEREALALMNHPNVARVFDAGATETGRPFFVMEYVAGIPITEYCDKHRLSTEERLRLFMDVCNAIQHAHQKGIIHRDIKPSNVLVTLDQIAPPLAKGGLGGVAVKVIDFGVAKATQHRLTERTLFTEQGQLIGTPGYMSPEQAEMTALDIDTRTDVYSLGVLLYELLVGAMPFDTKTLLQAGLAEIQRIIREVDPPKPSTRLSALGSVPRVPTSGSEAPADQSVERKRHDSIDDIAHRRHTEPKTLIRQIRGDLDWIVMRAMEKDRTRRYDTANGLAMEIQRQLNNEPVLAGPPTARYRIGKFVRRNKGAVAAGVVVTIVLIGGVVGTSYGLARAVRARQGEAEQRMFAEESEREAIAARDEAEQVTQFLTDTLAAADPEKQGKNVTVREVLDRAIPKISEKFANKPLIQAHLWQTVGWTYFNLGYYDAAESCLADGAATYQRAVGRNDRRTLGATSALASVLTVRGNYGPSEASLRSTLEIQRRVLGEEHLSTLASMDNLGILLYMQGRYAEAEQLHRKTLDIKRRVLGEEHPDTLATMQNLGIDLNWQGRYTEAEELYRKTLVIERRVLGEEHPQTLRSMGNLGTVLDNRGRYTEAEELYRKTLVIQRRVLGEEHQYTLNSMYNLGVVLNNQGRDAEAEELYRKTLEIQRRVLGEEHPDTLRSMSTLANVLDRAVHYAEAEALSRKTLEIKRRVLGAGHPDVAETLHNLASLLEKTGRYGEAEPLCRQAGAIWVSKLAFGHRNRRANDNLLGAIIAGQGRFAEAEPLLLESSKALNEDAGIPAQEKREFVERVVRLYEAWDAAEPGKDYAEKAAEWRDELDRARTEARHDDAAQDEH